MAVAAAIVDIDRIPVATVVSAAIIPTVIVRIVGIARWAVVTVIPGVVAVPIAAVPPRTAKAKAYRDEGIVVVRVVIIIVAVAVVVRVVAVRAVVVIIIEPREVTRVAAGAIVAIITLISVLDVVTVDDNRFAILAFILLYFYVVWLAVVGILRCRKLRIASGES